MRTLTVRFEDWLYTELSNIASGRGVTLSDLAREQLTALTTVEPEEGSSWVDDEAPATIPVLDRQQLALLHRILSYLVDGSGEDGDSAEQRRRAQVLERGYVTEYSGEFSAVEPEVSPAESEFVMDVLDMFERLEESYRHLDEADQVRVDKHSVRFGGFDLNRRRESRLLRYVRYLIDEGRWTTLAPYLDRKHDHGNSHMPTYDTYSRMVEVFRPMWKQKLRDGMGDPAKYRFNIDEILKITAARIHPSNRPR